MASTGALLQRAEARGLVLLPAVKEALLHSRPVVALESTIITHGMPFPHNLSTARAVEDIVRQHGAVPATIAVIKGRPSIGLSPEQMESLAKGGRSARKTALRDLSYVVSQGLDGATTVSATMLLAHMAGIQVFVTGGIGGVHRNGQDTLDISSDLTQLGRTPVAVVCAGAKSILDIPRTLEYLETQGVPVVTCGSDVFPAFFSRSSPCKSPLHLDSPRDCADMFDAHTRLQLNTGVLFAVPIPETHEAQGARVEEATLAALELAQSKGISGAALTPFLLAQVQALTEGESLAANVALIKHNAAFGAQIAAALCERLALPRL